VSHDYGKEWLELRGIKRLDVGTEKFPMPKKRSALGDLGEAGRA
jgi:hypothetical protein